MTLIQPQSKLIHRKNRVMNKLKHTCGLSGALKSGLKGGDICFATFSQISFGDRSWLS